MKRFLVFLCALLFVFGAESRAEELETETEIIIEEESNLETELVIVEEKEPKVEEETVKTYVYEDPHVILVILYAGSEEPAVRAIEPAREYVEFYGLDRDYFFYEVSGELIDVEVEFKGGIERIC